MVPHLQLLFDAKKELFPTESFCTVHIFQTATLQIYIKTHLKEITHIRNASTLILFSIFLLLVISYKPKERRNKDCFWLTRHDKS